MLLQTFVFFLSNVVPIFAVVINYGAVEGIVERPKLPIEVCGTPPPSDHLKEAHSNLRANPEARLSSEAVAASPLVVQVYVHFVSSQDQASRYSTTTRNNLVTNQVKLTFTSSIQKTS